jgi:hypothetical protein
LKWISNVPAISMIYGILIKMFFRDTDRHKLSHFHAEYQGQHAAYSINNGTVLAESLPPDKHKLAVAGIEIHRDELLADWDWRQTTYPHFASRAGPMNISRLEAGAD